MAEMIGDICVLSDQKGGDTWTVSICSGNGRSRPLGVFDDRASACDFAMEEAQRIRGSGQEVKVHFPDDCPCYFRVETNRR